MKTLKTDDRAYDLSRMKEMHYHCVSCRWKWSVYYSLTFPARNVFCPGCGRHGREIRPEAKEAG